MQKKKIFAQVVTLLLTLGVGILIGGRACSTTTREYMGPPPGRRMTCEEKIVYRCPVEKENPEQVRKGEEEKKKAPEKKKSEETKKKKVKIAALPDEGPEAQNKRRRLLSFVRDKSKATLQSCRGTDKQVYRLSVNLVAKKDGSVAKLKINSPPGEVPASILTCLRGRMKVWVLPKEDVTAQQSIIWGLKL